MDDQQRLIELAAAGGASVLPAHLDPKTAAVARLAASVASGVAPAVYRQVAADALAAGASVDEIVDTMQVVAATVGLARVVAAAPELAYALGYDIDAALEGVDDP